MYKSKNFRIRNFKDIEKEIDSLSSYSELRRVFIADGDALSIETPDLLDILKKLNDTFPKLRRISLYGNTRNILQKSESELNQLSEGGLSIIYLGFESGSDKILNIINKGVSKEEQAKAVKRAQECGIDNSATLITGLAGKEFWKEHIEQSAELVNMTSPKYLSTLSLMLQPDAHIKFTTPFTSFTPQNDIEILEEEKLLISLIDPPKRIIFRSNHTSNVLPLSGTLPRDKNKLIDQIDNALNSRNQYYPGHLK